eukprot:2251004-Rhodomonas_salina.1
MSTEEHTPRQRVGWGGLHVRRTASRDQTVRGGQDQNERIKVRERGWLESTGALRPTGAIRGVWVETEAHDDSATDGGGVELIWSLHSSTSAPSERESAEEGGRE